jgi:hypothetical protein
MPVNRAIVIAACLMLAAAARAEDVLQPPPLPAVGDVFYKGLVGTVLDAVPMDPDERVKLQRTSAVVSGTMTGRSLAAWFGASNPVLLVAGLVWGLFSASNIKVADARTKPQSIRLAEPLGPPELIEPVEVGQTRVALLIAPPEVQGER